MAIRAVFFDALATLVAPRLPIYVQYSQTFEPYLGALDPDLLKKSFKIGKPESRRPSDSTVDQSQYGSRIPTGRRARRCADMTHGVIATQSMTWRTALKQVQTEKPAYESGAEGWWGEVIKRTAIGAGADPQCK